MRCPGVIIIIMALAVATTGQRVSYTRTATRGRTPCRDDTDCLSTASSATIEEKIKVLAKQLIMQQFYTEEQTRANGNSGLKVMRMRDTGTRPYHGTSHSDDSAIAAIHDHADFFNTCGMGEVVAVLNGVEFKTRHNDYLLVKKCAASNDEPVGETEHIPYPEVPESVSSKDNINAQTAEMREYMRAWVEQDESIRDYKSYFKANLCYMEGAWTASDPGQIQEAFFSERHFFEARSWDDLFKKTRFTSYSGTKENQENYAFMPTTVWELKENGDIILGQWYYRILCHPLKDDLPLNRLRGIDDLKARMSTQKSFPDHIMSRNARFQVNPNDTDIWEDGSAEYGLLDDLMGQIPGMDGYGAVLHDESHGNIVKDFDSPPGSDTPLNTAYYHRWFQNDDNGVMGTKTRPRGFNDRNMWMAMNSQQRVLPIKLENCLTEAGERICQSWEQKWSYAIPLEIIYTTPLSSWNPHSIDHKGYSGLSAGQTVFDGPGGSRRDGSADVGKAFNGTNSVTFYRIPWEFFEENEMMIDPADTTKNFVHVLDIDGNMHKVRGSGLRTFLPKIPGIGHVRQRYPIVPLYSDGNPIAKELEALKDIVLHPDKYGFIYAADKNP